MAHEVTVDGTSLAVEIAERRPEMRLRIGNALYGLLELSRTERQFTIRLDGALHSGWWYAAENEVHVRLDGHTYVVGFADWREDASRGASASDVRAEMPGMVVAVFCKPGDEVQAGDRLLTTESMKLQMTVLAPHDSVVERVHVAENASFERGEVLVSFAARAAAE